MGTECVFCHENETDVHLFSCAGYGDLLQDVSYNMFMSLEAPIDGEVVLSAGAKKLILVKNRLENINISDKCIEDE